jgi:hypothetical protein
VKRRQADLKKKREDLAKATKSSADATQPSKYSPLREARKAAVYTTRAVRSHSAVMMQNKQ